MFAMPPPPNELRVLPSFRGQAPMPSHVLAVSALALARTLDGGAAIDRPRLGLWAAGWLAERCAGAPEQAPGLAGHELGAFAAALFSLRELAVPVPLLTAALARSGQPPRLAQALTRYTAALDGLGVDDPHAAARAALRGAAKRRWPAPLQGIERVVVEPGVELFGLPLAMFRAMAQSGRWVQVLLEARPETPATHGQAYDDALRTTLEQSTASRLGVGELPADASGARARCQVVRLPPASAGLERLAQAIFGVWQSGVQPERIAVVVPGSTHPHFVRGPRLQQLRDGLLALGVPCGPGPALRVADSALGRRLLDVLQWAASHVASGGHLIDLAAWGRLAEALWARWPTDPLGPTPPDPATPWMAGEPNERIAPVALSAYLQHERHLPAAAARAAAAHAWQRLAALALPLARASGWASTLHTTRQALATLAQATSAPEPVRQGIDELLEQWQREWAAMAACAADRGAAPIEEGSPAARLAFLQRSLLRERLRPPPPPSGVAFLRPEEVAWRAYEHVFVLGADEAIFFAPRRNNPFLPETLARALHALGGPALIPSAGIAQERPPRLRDRPDWLWQRVLSAATREVTACLLLPPPADDASVAEPACQSATANDVDIEAWAPLWQHELAEQPTLAAHRRAMAWRQRAGATAGSAWQQHLQERWLLWRSPRTHGVNAVLAGHLAALEQQREHAASALDELGRCRFRYMAQHLLGIREPLAFVHTASKQTLGIAMHEALREALQAWNHSPRPMGEAEQHRWLQQVHARFWLRADRYLPPQKVHRYLRTPALQSVWHAVHAALQQWLFDHRGVEHVWVEAKFGGEAAWPALRLPLPGVAEPLLIRGAIDRIDLQTHQLCVVDYKSSKPARLSGRHFQLPAYALVAARHLAPTKPLQAAWLVLSGRRAERVVATDLPPHADALAQTYAEHVQARLGPLWQGSWQAEPEAASTCRLCAFADACQQQWSRSTGQNAEESS